MIILHRRKSVDHMGNELTEERGGYTDMATASDDNKKAKSEVIPPSASTGAHNLLYPMMLLVFIVWVIGLYFCNKKKRHCLAHDHCS